MVFESYQTTESPNSDEKTMTSKIYQYIYESIQMTFPNETTESKFERTKTIYKIKKEQEDQQPREMSEEEIKEVRNKGVGLKLLMGWLEAVGVKATRVEKRSDCLDGSARSTSRAQVIHSENQEENHREDSQH